ncbi:hypothetical protein R1sor_026810 [Riccia sorocarpa]|uniref:Cytochrome P450 n=1 Tax=Riccia sorocarpa TaxID=122646 RepID=A0ABD3GCF2_9MARC
MTVTITCELRRLDFMFSVGGTDDISVTIEWALCELLKDSCILEEAQAEMDSVVGRERLVNESDLPNLPYLNAIVMETFRLHPAGVLIPRSSVEDCEIQGYNIPTKTSVFKGCVIQGHILKTQLPYFVMCGKYPVPNVVAPHIQAFVPQTHLQVCSYHVSA